MRENEWSNNSLIELMGDYEKDIFDSRAFYRDIETWPSNDELSMPDFRHSDPDLKLTMFKEYVLKRVNYMDNYVDELEINR